MTAEIAILNPHGVALAADSAVSVTTPHGQKTYNTANKLFALSKFHPVGMMIYGTGTFMGIPWEALVKVYRQGLRRRSFPVLRDYAEDFLGFLRERRGLFPEEAQQRFVYSSSFGLVHQLLKHGDARREAISSQGAAPPVLDAVEREARDYCGWLEKQSVLDSFADLTGENITGQYGAIMHRAIRDALGTAELAGATLVLLTQAAVETIRRDVWADPYAGLVVAGFGRDEMFPELVTYYLNGMLAQRLRCKLSKEKSVSPGNGAVLLPFAQQYEMVHTFMEGVHPEYHRDMMAYLDSLFKSLPEIVLSRLLPEAVANLQPTRSLLAEVLSSVHGDLVGFLNDYRRSRHVDPVVDTIAILPKDELAAMAETLVNLAVFKRRMSMEPETVGGPVDVAVISKGDGFIWIKRKHYFDPKLNPGFLGNYLAEGEASNE